MGLHHRGQIESHHFQINQGVADRILELPTDARWNPGVVDGTGAPGPMDPGPWALELPTGYSIESWRCRRMPDRILELPTGCPMESWSYG